MARFLLPFLVTVLCLSGCGKPEDPKAQVKGTVMLDGKPLAEGTITFVTPGKAPDILTITNGNFEGTVTVGDKRVEIGAYKDAPAQPSPMPDVKLDPGKINYLPPRYHSESKLKETVKAGTNEFKFEVESK